MYRIKSILPTNIMLTLYYALIYPYLNYCNRIWGCAIPSVLNKVIVLQKRAVRLVARESYRAPTASLFLRFKLLRTADINKLQTAIFMFKYKHCLLPESCMHYFTVSSMHPYETRKATYFKLLSYRTSIRERCISIWGPSCGIIQQKKKLLLWQKRTVSLGKYGRAVYGDLLFKICILFKQ